MKKNETFKHEDFVDSRLCRGFILRLLLRLLLQPTLLQRRYIFAVS